MLALYLLYSQALLGCGCENLRIYTSCNPILGRRTKSFSRLQGLTFGCVYDHLMLDKTYVICSWGKTQFHTGLFNISGRQRASSADLCKRLPIFLGKLHHITHTHARTTLLVSGTTPLETPFRVKTLQLLCTYNVQRCF